MDLQDRFLPGRAACFSAGSVSWGDQGAGFRPRHMAQCVVGVMLKSQLEKAASFLDQQINLGRTGVWTGEPQVVRGSMEGTALHPAHQTQGPYLIQGHIPNGCAIDFQDPVSNMNGILHIWTHAAWVHSVGTEQWSDPWPPACPLQP